MPFLVFLSGPSAGTRCEVLKAATLGRSRACDVPIEDERVSRRHARIWVDEGRARLRDLESRNGTTVNGHRVVGEVELLSGDLLQLGDTVLRYELTPATSAEPDSNELRRWPAAELLRDFEGEGIHRWASALLLAGGEQQICRTAVDELARVLKTPSCLALIAGSGPAAPAPLAGATSLQVPQFLFGAVLERKEVCRTGRLICFPLCGSEGVALGALCAEREQELSQEELAAGAILSRLAGDGLAAVRRRPELKPLTLIGTAAAFRDTLKKAERWSDRSGTILLYGEPGCGKGLLAEYIHSCSGRARGPCVVLNCAAEPGWLEAELFGRHDGDPSIFERADGGTLILRHIELLPKPLARRLSTLLEQIRAQAGHSLDVRVLATAAQPLEVLAARRKFEHGLVQALPGVNLEVPALRKRRGDVPALFKAFATDRGLASGVEPARLSPQAERAFIEYRWPGNVAELRLAAERLTLLYSGLEVGTSKLPPEMLDGASDLVRPLRERVLEVERQAIARALREAGGKKIRAAAILGISRPTLDKKIRDLRLGVESRKTN
jgi:transcriptional regulator with AAA-type ATPase domain